MKSRDLAHLCLCGYWLQKKLNNLMVHMTVIFQSASNSDTKVNHEKIKVA